MTFAWDAGQMGEAPAEARAAIESVATALDLALTRAGADEVTHKDARDIVTADDIAIEDQIRGDLGEAIGIEVVGEERGGEASASGEYWMLDPICGTRNYASGIPLYCVNLALVRDAAPVLAVIGDASTGEILVARAGGGAWSLRRDGGRRRLRTDAASQTLIVEPGKSNDARREMAAQFSAATVRADRWDLLSPRPLTPSRSMSASGPTRTTSLATSTGSCSQSKDQTTGVGAARTSRPRCSTRASSLTPPPSRRQPTQFAQSSRVDGLKTALYKRFSAHQHRAAGGELVRGRYEDAVLYAMLASDWPPPTLEATGNA